jgi:hypothetical protein
MKKYFFIIYSCLILLFLSGCKQYWDNPFYENFYNPEWGISKLEIKEYPEYTHINWQYTNYGFLSYLNTISRSVDRQNWHVIVPNNKDSYYVDYDAWFYLFSHDTIWYRVTSYTYYSDSTELNRTAPKDTFLRVDHLRNNLLNLKLEAKDEDKYILSWNKLVGHIVYIYQLDSVEGSFLHTEYTNSTFTFYPSSITRINGFGILDFVSDTLFSISKITNPL